MLNTVIYLQCTTMGLERERNDLFTFLQRKHLSAHFSYFMLLEPHRKIVHNKTKSCVCINIIFNHQ